MDLRYTRLADIADRFDTTGIEAEILGVACIVEVFTMPEGVRVSASTVEGDHFAAQTFAPSLALNDAFNALTDCPKRGYVTPDCWPAWSN